jgi:hypothetical protein
LQLYAVLLVRRGTDLGAAPKKRFRYVERGQGSVGDLARNDMAYLQSSFIDCLLVDDRGLSHLQSVVVPAAAIRPRRQREPTDALQVLGEPAVLKIPG